jgi:hypothetical protein
MGFHISITGERSEVSRESIQALLEMFRFPVEALPLIYVVLQFSQSDVVIASSHIVKGGYKKERIETLRM